MWENIGREKVIYAQVYLNQERKENHSCDLWKQGDLNSFMLMQKCVKLNSCFLFEKRGKVTGVTHN